MTDSVAYRIGALNPNGGEAFRQRTKTYNFMTRGRLEGKTWTQGFMNCHDFPVTCVNDPMNILQTTIGFSDDSQTNIATGLQPQNHDLAVADGYKVYEVLSSMYILDVKCNTIDVNDIVIYWSFQRTADDGVTSTGALSTAPARVQTLATTNTISLKNNLQAAMDSNARWSKATFSGNAYGGSRYPNDGRIIIPIPSVKKLGFGLWADYQDSTTHSANAVLDDTGAAFKGVLGAANTATNGELGRYFLSIYMLKNGPSDTLLILDDTILIDVNIVQRVKLYRDMDGTGIGSLFDTPNAV